MNNPQIGLVENNNRTNLSSVFLLVLVNIWPIFGVYFFNWNITNILILYWSENLIIGFINIFKMSLAKKPGKLEETNNFIFKLNESPLIKFHNLPKAFLIGYFIFHYGIFTFGHGLFLFTFASNGIILPKADLYSTALGIAWLLMLISHLVSYWTNFVGKKEYENISAYKQMFVPYSRIFVLHICIVAAGFLVVFFGSPKPLIILLVLLKIAIDLNLHFREHKIYKS